MRYYYIVAYVLCSVRCDNDYDSYFENFDPAQLLARTKSLNLNQTFFPTIENYQVNATPILNADYPWVGRLVHSKNSDFPTICMVSCISKRIFITAARCIYSLKLEYTRIIFWSQRLTPLVFVMPSHNTKQLFDDIGIIVVKNEYTGSWYTVELTDAVRTDDAFQWFADLAGDEVTADYTAIALATEKGLHRIIVAYRKYNLYSMPVVVGIDICSKMLCFNSLINGFLVPCFHTCNLQEFESRSPKCSKYLGSEGGAVIDSRTNKLIGIMTWAAYYGEYELPVGLSVPNSNSFLEDYECARRIRDDPKPLKARGYLQSLCDY